MLVKSQCSSEVLGQAHHGHPKEARGRMQEMVAREWVRHEAVVMEKVQDIIAELYSQSEGEL